MKERYNSEKGLKKAFDNYQMTFDGDAFDTFKIELDKEDKRRKFVWWMFYGKIIAPLVILGVAILSIVYFPVINKNSEQTSAITINSNAAKKSEQTSAITINNNAAKNLEQTSAITINHNAAKKSNQNSIQSTEKNNIKNEETNVPVVKENLGSIVSEYASPATTLLKERKPVNFGFSKENNLLVQEVNLSKEIIQDLPLVDLNSEETNNAFDQPELKLKQIVEDLDLLNSLELSQINRQNVINLAYTGQIEPYVAKFKKHFYFNFGIGLTKEDNFGNVDPFFDISKTSEVLWRTSVAYQVSSKTSIELSFIRKNISLGYKLKNFTHWGKVGSKVSMIKIGMVNKMRTYNPRLSLNLTNGISLLKATQSFNEGGDFSKTVSSQNVPSVISNINFDWQGLYSSNHFMYSSGLRLDYQLSRNLELNFDAEYTLGFKPIAKANLNYIEGEGLLKSVETHSNSSFASISLGIKYRMRKE